MNKYFVLTGAIASIIYISHVIIGSILWKDYKHLSQSISDLTAIGAPNRVFLSRIIYFYAIFSLFFSLILLKNYNISKSFRVGTYLFFIMQIISLAYSFFPQDSLGSQITFKGFMHLFITALIIPLTILAPIFIGVGLKNEKELYILGNISVLCGILIFIFGGLTAIFFVKKNPFRGLMEKINIGILQVWIFLLSISLYINF